MVESKQFFKGVLEDRSIGGIEKSLAGRSLEEVELEELGLRVLGDDWSLPATQRRELRELVDALTTRRARNEKHLRARIARMQTLTFRTPITK